MGLQALEKLGKTNMLENVKIEDDAILRIKNCTKCAQGKQSRTNFTPSESRFEKILELIHTDIMGLIENVSLAGKKYVQ
jgi:hypothetical protein